MTRDWKLIRAVLLKEPLDGRSEREVLHHLMICRDRGLIRGDLLVNGVGEPAEFLLEEITNQGHEMAARLSDLDRLEAALATLDAQGLGAEEDLLMRLLAQ
jgi:hypothetical protein